MIITETKTYRATLDTDELVLISAALFYYTKGYPKDSDLLKRCKELRDAIDTALDKE